MKKEILLRITAFLFIFLAINHYFNFINIGYSKSKYNSNHNTDYKYSSNTIQSVIHIDNPQINIPGIEDATCPPDSENCFDIKINHASISISNSRYIPLIKSVSVESKIQFESTDHNLDIKSDLSITSHTWYFGIYSSEGIKQEAYSDIAHYIKEIISKKVTEIQVER